MHGKAHQQTPPTSCRWLLGGGLWAVIEAATFAAALALLMACMAGSRWQWTHVVDKYLELYLHTIPMAFVGLK